MYLPYICNVVEKLMKHTLLLIALLFGLFGQTNWAKGQGLSSQNRQEGTCITQIDGLMRTIAEEQQRPYGLILQSSPSSQSIGSSRPSRTLPSHGPKPSRQLGIHGNCLSTTLKYASLHLYRSHLKPRTGVASPRLYYVIAMRRVLC